MNTKISIYIPGENPPENGEPIKRAIADLDQGIPYAEMMRHRTAGKAAEECTDIYYLCTDERGDLVSRLWMGWGKHARAVGNWGNFFTSPECRGQGIGRQMLNFWQNDVKTRQNLPLALFCTAGDEGLAKLYAPYGFRPAIKNATCGPLYCPLGDSPKAFREFCEQYYTPAKSLDFKKATLEWRHEIDCLLKFAMLDAGLNYLPEGMTSLEASLVENGAKRIDIIFTDTNIPVGLARVRDGGKCDISIHPNYLHLI
jgi:GNAT superfamily N-acetyltransferase